MLLVVVVGEWLDELRFVFACAHPVAEPRRPTAHALFQVISIAQQAHEDPELLTIAMALSALAAFAAGAGLPLAASLVTGALTDKDGAFSIAGLGRNTTAGGETWV